FEKSRFGNAKLPILYMGSKLTREPLRISKVTFQLSRVYELTINCLFNAHPPELLKYPENHESKTVPFDLLLVYHSNFHSTAL
ncbi:MAG: hypothetical protein ACOYKR_08460, partial [Sphingobacterium thalpophilum]